jgi:outer membrane lipoprotein-sorting protein
MTLSRRALALGLAAAPLTAAPVAVQAQAALAPADRALVDRAVTYLEGLSEAKGRFVQTDARGRTVTGALYLKRPGKARFAYDAPSGLLVVSDGGVVSVQDPRLKTFDQYPLSATPLSLFLARTIRLDRGVAIARVARARDGFSITARDGRRETAGEITLDFVDNPLRLSGWTVVDAQRRPTRISLIALDRASGLDRSLFVLKDPRPKTPGRGKV